jgi:hypothetical protein
MDLRFRSATGQDLLPWLPLVLEGVLIEGYLESDRMLWEWRRFLADEIAENYHRVMADFAEEKGMTCSSEASGRQMFMYDPIGYQRIAPVPKGEFWVGKGRGQYVRVDNKAASSAAHLTGSKWVASESYTSRPASCKWDQHPYSLKVEGDLAFCAGVNKFVFHTYAHQPYPGLKPGFTMARYGMHNHSGNTWWNGRPVEAWMEYITRCQYMLQEGRFHADILAFLGEDVPARLGWRDEFEPPIPPGYDFDGCDFQALLDARVENGEILLPGGMRYRVILLPDKTRMRPAVARRIAKLVRQGVTVISPARPNASPGFDKSGEDDRVIRSIVEEFWADDEPGNLKGKVIPSGEDLGKLLPDLGIRPDFEYTAEGDADIRYIHRLTGDADYYFLSNQEDREVALEAVFRQPAGKEFSLWDPSTGKITRGTYVLSHDGYAVANLRLDPGGSVFAVFSDQDLDPEPALKIIEETEFRGTWELRFPAGSGVPAEVMPLDELIDWTRHGEFGVRHFSGTATYTSTLMIAEGSLEEGERLMLDLGEVREMAQVLINGIDAAMLWKPPFRADITRLLVPGENMIEVRVTNLWVNRLIGDEHFPDEIDWYDSSGDMLPASWPDWLTAGGERPESPRITWTTRGKIWSAGDPLIPSGLLGPVKLISAYEITR